MKIKFLKTRVVQDGSGQTFHAGKVYDLNQASAERWIRRQVAIACEPEVKPVIAPIEEPQPEPKAEEPAIPPVAETAADPVPAEGHTVPGRQKPDALSRGDIKRIQRK